MTTANSLASMCIGVWTLNPDQLVTWFCTSKLSNKYIFVQSWSVVAAIHVSATAIIRIWVRCPLGQVTTHHCVACCRSLQLSWIIHVHSLGLILQRMSPFHEGRLLFLVVGWSCYSRDQHTDKHLLLKLQRTYMYVCMYVNIRIYTYTYTDHCNRTYNITSLVLQSNYRLKPYTYMNIFTREIPSNYRIEHLTRKAYNRKCHLFINSKLQGLKLHPIGFQCPDIDGLSRSWTTHECNLDQNLGTGSLIR